MAFARGPAVVKNGLVLWLDAANRSSYGGSGTLWRDMSGNGNNGTLTNGPTFSSANGGTLVFDGINDYVDLGQNKLKYQDNFTIEAFFNFPTIPNNPGSACSARYPVVYNHDYGYNLFMNNTGRILWQIYNTSSTNGGVTTSQVLINQWVHAVGYKSGTTMGFYVNGSLVGTTTLTTNAVYYEANPFVIGGFGVCGPDRFYSTGNISLIKGYSRVLSASEILQNYNALKGRYGL